jgi:hypothetical protein
MSLWGEKRKWKEVLGYTTFEGGFFLPPVLKVLYDIVRAAL